jgi:23S rRNA (cytosine1962-C5)-methyltransferase
MQPAATTLNLITTTGPSGYALLDSGHGRKLETFGAVIVDRPEAQAIWPPRLPKAEWAKAYAAFSASGEDDEKGKWRVDKPVPESWPVKVGGVTMQCKLSGLWHLGLFPEQHPHWQWMVERISCPLGQPEPQTPLQAAGPLTPTLSPEGRGSPPFRVLNLFGYTGAASLLAAAAGAEVVHVDASKKAVAWGRENQAASKLNDKPVRWICEDARKFVAREVRRNRTYHVILVDPPKFGRGPDGEVWDLFEHLPSLVADCAKLLAPEGSHMVLTAYAIRASALMLDGLMRETLEPRGGTIESGELALTPKTGGPLVGTSLYSRWSAPSHAD